MVRNGPWKLYFYAGESVPVLFNLEDDPEEMNDLGSDPSYETVRAQLLQRLYDGWDPGYVSKATDEDAKDMAVLTDWGKAVQPRHEDPLPVPENAEDIVLL